jgi:menaquinol-cytochrome c reductase iron-sulfur subunit
VDDFAIGETILVKFRSNSALPWTGVTSQTASWLRRVSDRQFIAFTVNCTHLGCPVRWIPDAGIFMCPCHGGVYNKDGSYAAGPPPHGLAQYPVRIINGQVEIQAAPLPITKI